MARPGAAAPPLSGGSELERLRAKVAAYFPVYETRVGPQSLQLSVHVDRGTLSKKFHDLAHELWAAGYVPILKYQTGEYTIDVIRRPPSRESRIWINLLLLFATIASTVFTGALIWASYIGSATLGASDLLWGGLYFAAPLMAALGLHELAHYLVARRYHLDASLPYFMPIPPPFLFGTLGAFISIRQPFTNRKALFDIGAAGPIAGFLVSVPVAIAGIVLSIHAPVLPLSACGPTFLGTSYTNLAIGLPPVWFVFSYFLPASLVSLHPLALAGWVGIFVTSINLLPAGQLDGGHVFRALFGDRTRYVSYGVAAILVFFGLVFYLGWLIFAFLVVALGLRHPPPLDDVSPLGGARAALGVAVIAILIAGFTLVPVAAPSGQIHIPLANSLSTHPSTGYRIAGNLTTQIENPDLVAHGFVFVFAVTSVWVNGTNGTLVPLNSTALANWAATSNWTFVFSGATLVVNDSAVATVPGGGGYYAINSSASLNLSASYANRQAAAQVRIQLTASEVCAPEGSGPASATFPLIMRA